jgi:hypothetical protein
MVHVMPSMTMSTVCFWDIGGGGSGSANGSGTVEGLSNRGDNNVDASLVVVDVVVAVVAVVSPRVNVS